MPFDRRTGDRRESDRRQGDRRIANRRKGPLFSSPEDGPRTPEEINELRSGLEYEMWMLRKVAGYLTRHGTRVGEPDLNAYIESFLLHAATLIDFYFPPETGVIEDVIARDYVPAWDEDAGCSNLLRWTREAAGRGLGRISKRTLDLPTKAQVAAICEELEALRTKFELGLQVQAEIERVVGSEEDQEE